MSTITHHTDAKNHTSDSKLPKITFRVTREFRRRLKNWANDNETTVEDLCKHAVEKHMEATERETSARAS